MLRRTCDDKIRNLAAASSHVNCAFFVGSVSARNDSIRCTATADVCSGTIYGSWGACCSVSIVQSTGTGFNAVSAGCDGSCCTSSFGCSAMLLLLSDSNSAALASALVASDYTLRRQK